MSVKIDKTMWSNSSKRSSEYTGQFKDEEFYSESIGYRCVKCNEACIFAPEEQKKAFEVEKRIIHYVPSLCPKCKAQYSSLKNEFESFQNKWNESKEMLKTDKEFIHNWLSIVREINSYGKNTGTTETMLVKLRRDLPSEEQNT